VISLMLVTSLPGIDRTNLLDTLQKVRTDLASASSVAGAAHTRIYAYIGWVNDSARALAGVISSADVARLLWTESYRIAMSSLGNLVHHHAEAALDQLIALEVQQRAKAFDEVITELDRLIERWSGPEVFVVPDTSFFIKDPTEVDKRDIAASLNLAGEPIRLIVPIVVVDELDNLKHSELRGFAQRTLAIFDRVLVDPTKPEVLRDAANLTKECGVLRGDVSIELLLDQPGHVRASIADDEIIGRALAIKPIADREITVITYDTGQSMRARAAKLHTVKLQAPAPQPKSKPKPKGGQT
jgi:rRNA-processing protein FCF1